MIILLVLTYLVAATAGIVLGSVAVSWRIAPADALARRAALSLWLGTVCLAVLGICVSVRAAGGMGQITGDGEVGTALFYWTVVAANFGWVLALLIGLGLGLHGSWLLDTLTRAGDRLRPARGQARPEEIAE